MLDVLRRVLVVTLHKEVIPDSLWGILSVSLRGFVSPGISAHIGNIDTEREYRILCHQEFLLTEGILTLIGKCTCFPSEVHIGDIGSRRELGFFCHGKVLPTFGILTLIWKCTLFPSEAQRENAISPSSLSPLPQSKR